MSINMDGIDRQNKEFDALKELIKRWNILQRVAVVDDDYPEVRHHYESAMRNFVGAIENNGRFRTFLSFDYLRGINIRRCVIGFKHALESWSVAEWTNAVAGEAGEAANVAKKMIRFRDNIRGNPDGATRESFKKKLAQELADTVLYADLTAASEGIDLGEAVRETFNNKSDEIGCDIKL